MHVSVHKKPVNPKVKSTDRLFCFSLSKFTPVQKHNKCNLQRNKSENNEMDTFERLEPENSWFSSFKNDLVQIQVLNHSLTK